MSQDKERETFEAWYFDKYLRPPAKDEDGFYTVFHARDAWEGWQARAALATQQAGKGEPVGRVPVAEFLEDGTLRWLPPYPVKEVTPARCGPLYPGTWEHPPRGDGRYALQLADLILSMDMATEKGQRARELARKVQEEWHESPAELALREIACALGVGGYNAPFVDVQQYKTKILEEYVHSPPSREPLTEWEARGMLARLKCWHRLTEQEADELVQFAMQGGIHSREGDSND